MPLVGESLASNDEEDIRNARCAERLQNGTNGNKVMADVGEEENAGDYHDLFHYLSKQRYPENYSDNQKKTLRRKAKNFKYADGFLYYYFNKTGLLHKVLLTSESRIEALAKAHKEADTGRHCGIQKTTSRLLNEFCYYWRGFTRDIKNFVRDCTVCSENPENEDNEAAIPSPTSKEEINHEVAAPAVDLDPSCNSQQTCSESEFNLAPTIQCPDCSEHFTSKFSFRIHQRKHADGRNQSEVSSVNENNSAIGAAHCQTNVSPNPADEKTKLQGMNSQSQPQPQSSLTTCVQQDQMPVTRNCTSTSETLPTQSDSANASQPKDLSVQVACKSDLVPRGLGSFWAEMIDAIKVKDEKGDEKWWFNHGVKSEVWDMHTGPSSVAFPTSDPMNAHLARSYATTNCLPVSTAEFCQAQLAPDVLRTIPLDSPVIASNSMNNGTSFQLPMSDSNATCECPNCKGNSVTDGGVPNNDVSCSSNSNNNDSSRVTNNIATSASKERNPGSSKPPGKLHSCHIPGCTKVFKKSWHLKAHVRTHTGERPFQCQWPSCNKRFTRSDKLHRHMSVHTEERKFSCFICDRRFVRNDCLTQHLKSHEIVVANKTIPCSDLVKKEPGESGDSNADVESVGNMLATLTGGTVTVLPAPSLMKLKVYPCPYTGCEKMFKKTWHLKAHVCSHTGEKPFICGWPNCGKRFTRSDKLNRHMNTHTDGKQFPCPLCNKRFVRSDYVNHHIRVQHGKNPSDYHFPTPKSIRDDSNNNDSTNGNTENTSFNHVAGPSQPPAFPHLVNCLPPPPSPSQHQTCTANENDTGENTSTLNLMQSIVCEQDKVPCPAEHCPANHCPDGQCAVGHCPTAPPGDFGRPTKTYPCSVEGCTKVFNKSWHLKAHTRSHTGEKPFACNWPLCGKRFTRSDKLYRHALMHTDGKRFSCSLCEKRFVRSDNLNQHVKTHYKQAKRKDKCLTGRRKKVGLTYPPTLVTNPYPSYQANFITSL